ncbi:MAG: hypothetical protein BAA01_15355 [Bacillus thermozeamaize]|uniref:Uncharacterized protein n=1 Tax=Bacillus thermozeamaize TaxID=230954 RepID=A0A1Y3PAU4_9BACI|nr:MAG: hypothetical protein BAA01_15355 [Bacillus thermozeamaize]
MKRRHLVLSVAYSPVRRLTLLAACLVLSVAVAARVSREGGDLHPAPVARAATASHTQHVQEVGAVRRLPATDAAETAPPVPVGTALASTLAGCVTVVGLLVQRYS